MHENVIMGIRKLMEKNAGLKQLSNHVLTASMNSLLWCCDCSKSNTSHVKYAVFSLLAEIGRLNKYANYCFTLSCCSSLESYRHLKAYISGIQVVWRLPIHLICMQDFGIMPRKCKRNQWGCDLTWHAICERAAISWCN